MTKTRIGVVRGGPSSEYEISLRTGAAVIDSLDKEKYEPLDIVISKDGPWHLHGLEIKPHEVARRVDVIFNALHGYYGEDGKIQQLLESHSIPFTGSGSLSSAIAMNKILAKEYFRRAGLKTPMHVLIEGGTARKEINATKAYLLAHSRFPLPYIVKPVSAGSSIGVSMVKSRNDFALALDKAFEFGHSAMVEEYIPGIEANVGVIQGFRGKDLYVLPPVEIRPVNRTFFDYEAKYGSELENYALARNTSSAATQDERRLFGHERSDMRKSASVVVGGADQELESSVPQDSAGVIEHNHLLGGNDKQDLGLSRSEEIVPATFSPSIKKDLEKLAIAAHSALGLRHYSRSDFIISPRRGIFILETNTLPGLTDESLVPKALKAVGSSLSEFAEHLISLALDE